MQRDMNRYFAYRFRVVLGRGYLKQGRYAEAVEMLQQADELAYIYWGYCRLPLEKAREELAKLEGK